MARDEVSWRGGEEAYNGALKHVMIMWRDKIWSVRWHDLSIGAQTKKEMKKSKGGHKSNM